MNKKLAGIHAALLTPYNTDKSINYSQLKKIVRHLINQGIDGFYVGGSTAETFLLSQDERKRLLEAVVEENNGEKIIMAHIGEISTTHTIELGKHAKTCNVDAVSAITPFYYKFSADEVVAHYNAIMDECETPLIVYNFPNLSGFEITSDILKKLNEHKYMSGVKFTSNNFYSLQRMLQTAPELTYFNGFDEMLSSGLIAGASGGIGSTYNCMCTIIRKLYNAFLVGDINKMSYYQNKVNDVIQVLIKHGVMQAEKRLMDLQGFSLNGCRKPFGDLSQEGIEDIDRMYRETILPELS